MALLTVQNVADLAGLVNPTFDAAAPGGDTVPVVDGLLLIIDNGGGGSITVTFNDQGTPTPPQAKSFDPDVDLVIPAGQVGYITGFEKKRFGSPLEIAYSGTTSVTVAALVV